MKDRKKIKKIAEKVAALETQCRVDKDNINKYLLQMQQLTENLSLEDLLAIDEYIMQNNLLK